jgi:predicted acyl esterase
MVRALTLAAITALLWCGAATAGPWAKTDQKVTATDGVQLATSLYEPVGAPPVGGWPAIVMFHGIGGTRSSMNTLAELYYANQGYAVLTVDHRGHGESGGLFNTVSPQEVRDARTAYDWLAARTTIDKGHIGAWGISLGGGVVWNALRAGVPFAVAEVFETWVDLYQALAPRDLSKSGAIFQFLGSVAADRTDPELNGIKTGALSSTNQAALEAYADARSVRGDLARIKTPTYVFQGRRDFAFGLEQGLEAYRGLAGPKALYIGDFGHAPSTFPGADAAPMFATSSAWFDAYLKGIGNTPIQPVQIAPDPWHGNVRSYASLPPTTTVKTKTVKVNRTFGTRGKTVVTFTLPNKKLEVFGAPVISVTASTKTNARQLVAVVESIARNGAATIVSEGGTQLPTARTWKLSFPLISDTALIAPGSKLRVTLSWTSTAQNPANLLYLTGVPDGSSLTVKTLRVALPVLAKPIS